MPAEAYKILKDFYDQKKKQSTVEDWHPYGTQINFDAVETRMVELPQETKYRVGEVRGIHWLAGMCGPQRRH